MSSFLERILQAANRLQQPLHHKLLVEDRKLDRDPRQIGKMPAGSIVRFFLCL